MVLVGLALSPLALGRVSARSVSDSQASASGVSSRTTIVARSMTLGGVEWSVVRDADSCVSVLAELNGVQQGSVGSACSSSGWGWGIGGVDVGDQWFNVVYGQAPTTVASVRVSLADGNELTDSAVRESGGAWLAVMPADPTAKASDVVTISALDAEGSVVVEEKPPPISDYRQAAKDNPAS